MIKITPLISKETSEFNVCIMLETRLKAKFL